MKMMISNLSLSSPWRTLNSGRNKNSRHATGQSVFTADFSSFNLKRAFYLVAWLMTIIYLLIGKSRWKFPLANVKITRSLLFTRIWISSQLSDEIPQFLLRTTKYLQKDDKTWFIFDLLMDRALAIIVMLSPSTQISSKCMLNLHHLC